MLLNERTSCGENKIDFIGAPAGWAHIVSVEVVESLRKSNPEIVLHPVFHCSDQSYDPDASKLPFDDIRVRKAMQMTLDLELYPGGDPDRHAVVRKAMQMALDLEGINNTYYKGTAMWQPQGLVGEGITGYFTPFEEWPEEVKKGYMYDPAGAEALLDEVGYPRGADGTRFKTVLNHFHRFDLGYSELAAIYWADLGVDVEINVLDEASGGATRSNRTWEGLVFHLLGNNGPPLAEVRNWVHSSGIADLHGVPRPELDALIDAAQATTSEEERQELVKEVDMRTMENHWWIWGPKVGSYMAHQPWVIGFNGEVWLSYMNRTI